jgi:hypothetical protein
VTTADPFGDLFGTLFDFWGAGSLPPESVARKMLGIGGTLPLDKAGIHAAFRFRVRLLRPDITDDAADALRAKDLSDGATDVDEAEWRPAGEITFESGSKQEQLAELLWAREFLLGRLPKPVTATGGSVRVGSAPTAPVTEWGKRRQERAEKNLQARREREDREREERTERESREAERRREWRRELRREAKRRRAERAPRDLRCKECHQVIDRADVAIVGDEWQGEFSLNAYAVSRRSWFGGYYHAACLLDLPLRPVRWLEKYLADGVPLETECAVCGRRVKPPRWIKRRDGGKVFYCSEGCAGGADAIARRVEREARTCVVCGDEFTPGRSDGRYCSSACRQDAYRKRKLGGMPA